MGMDVLSARVNKVFFDSKELLETLDKTEIRVHSKFGAYVMTSDRRSMRKVNKKGEPSKEGQPPKERLGHLKRGRYAVSFGYDLNTKSVVIGAEIFPGLKKRNSDTMPATIEKGGDVLVDEAAKKDGSWSRRGMKWARLNGKAMRQRRARMGARPHTGPAFEREKPKLMGMWANAMERV